jgi:glycosyltransferase involved in cell wall biosynthesis
MKKSGGKLSILLMASVRWYNASAHYSLSLAEELVRVGQRVVVFGMKNSPIIIKARQSGIDVFDGINLMFRGPLAHIGDIFKFRGFVSEMGFDIIHAHFSRDQVFAYYSLIGQGVPLIRTRSESTHPKRNLFNVFFYRRSAMHYAVTAGYMKPVIRDMGVEEERISIVPLSIDFMQFSRYRPKRDLKIDLGIHDNRLVVSYVGRLHTVKGVEYILRCYPYLKNRERFHFIISGEEIDVRSDYLHNLASEYGIGNISFLNRLDDVREILSITDIGIIPSIGSEAICRVALEMLAFGIPVIGSRVNSIPEVISDYGGIVVTPGMPAEIAGALDRLVLGNEYRRVSNHIKSKISKQSPDRMLREYMDIYMRVIQGVS